MGVATLGMNQVIYLEPAPTPDSPHNYDQVYPCRCGATHRGVDAASMHRYHQCFHAHLSIIGTSPTGELTVYCKDCETAWLAPVECSGMTIALSETGLQQGCDQCQAYVLTKLKEEHPDHLDYDCPECGFAWHIKAGTEEI